MKAIFTLWIASLSLNLWAGPIEEKVKDIESLFNVQCIQTTKTIFSKCFGYPQTCFYNVKFKCLSSSNQFKLKVKVKENYNGAVLVRKTVIKSL